MESQAHEVIFGWSGNVTGSSNMFWNVFDREAPLNGVVANCTTSHPVGK